MPPLLEVNNLRQYFPIRGGVFRGVKAHVRAVDDVSLTIQPGQTLAGRALTVAGEYSTGRARDDYFLPFLKMLGSIAPGDVVVSQPNDHTIAHFGELSCETANPDD